MMRARSANILAARSPLARPAAARTGFITATWSLLATVALLWPSRIVGPLDGAPLDARAEVLVIGLIAPAVWWLDRGIFTTRWARALVVALLAWKAAAMGLQQQGLCVHTSAGRPLVGTAMTMRVEEPSGALRSWDVRADWQSATPACTAILARPLPALADFPAWFLNLTDTMIGERDLTMRISGYVTVAAAQSLTVSVDRDVRLSARVDDDALPAEGVRLEAGTHVLDVMLGLSGHDWRFEPRLDGRSLWDAALVTTAPPGAVDRMLAPWAWLVAPMLVLALVAGASIRVIRSVQPNVALAGWLAGSSLAAILLGSSPFAGLQRFGGAIVLGAAAVPLPSRLRTLRTAFLMIGMPWLTFFAARSWPEIGRITSYSQDDWLAYQVAGYRIFLNGAWLEGGTAAFDYQPLYRWIAGALHLVFGDSSVGEIYWDAACLLIGALLAFYVTRVRAGFTWGLVAAGATLATCTIGTPWYFFGRGLSEIAAAGWAFLAMFFLLRGRQESAAWIAAATVMAVLMFYTRLNHLLWAAFLPAMLLPLRTPCVVDAAVRAVRRIPHRSLAIYGAGFTAGVLLFMARTWHYTGVWSLFYGTSLRHNDTGLRPWRLFDGDVWAKVGHSLASFAWLNEPPRIDPRAAIIVLGLVVGIAAALQVPAFRRLPAALVLTAAGASIGAFFAHAHGYPGRFSIHALPLASALVCISAADWLKR